MEQRQELESLAFAILVYGNQDEVSGQRGIGRGGTMAGRLSRDNASHMTATTAPQTCRHHVITTHRQEITSYSKNEMTRQDGTRLKPRQKQR